MFDIRITILSSAKSGLPKQNLLCFDISNNLFEIFSTICLVCRSQDSHVSDSLRIILCILIYSTLVILFSIVEYVSSSCAMAALYFLLYPSLQHLLFHLSQFCLYPVFIAFTLPISRRVQLNTTFVVVIVSYRAAFQMPQMHHSDLRLHACTRAPFKPCETEHQTKNTKQNRPERCLALRAFAIAIHG